MKILSNNAFTQLLKDSNNLIELQWKYKAATDRVAELIEKVGELEEENKLLKANTKAEWLIFYFFSNTHSAKKGNGEPSEAA